MCAFDLVSSTGHVAAVDEARCGDALGGHGDALGGLGDALGGCKIDFFNARN